MASELVRGEMVAKRHGLFGEILGRVERIEGTGHKRKVVVLWDGEKEPQVCERSALRRLHGPGAMEARTHPGKRTKPIVAEAEDLESDDAQSSTDTDDGDGVQLAPARSKAQAHPDQTDFEDGEDIVSPPKYVRLHHSDMRACCALETFCGYASVADIRAVPLSTTQLPQKCRGLHSHVA